MSLDDWKRGLDEWKREHARLKEKGMLMTFLSVSDETCEALMLLRHEDETDDDLIKRIMEYARCYMILRGMENNE